MILFSKENKEQAIDTLELACKTFLVHGMAKPDYHKIEMLLYWMRQQPEDLNVTAKLSADQTIIKLEVSFTYVPVATDATANG